MPSETARLQTYVALVEIGLREVFNAALEGHPELYHKWLLQRRAKEWIEDDRVLSGFQMMPEKTVGGEFTIDRPLLGAEKDYTLKTYGLGFVIENELIEWDQYDKFKKPTALMARSGRERKNVLAYSILNNATDSAAPSEFLIYNGEEICNNAHVLLRGGTGKNAPTNNLGLSYIGVQSALTDLALTENEDGLFAIVEAQNLLCHPSKEWEAQEIVGSEYRPDNANNAKNTLRNRLSVHSAPFLTSTTRWFVTASKNRLEAAFCIGRDLTFRRDYQISTWNQMFTMYMSARVEVLTWPGFWGTDGV